MLDGSIEVAVDVKHVRHATDSIERALDEAVQHCLGNSNVGGPASLHEASRHRKKTYDTRVSLRVFDVELQKK